MKQKKFFIIGLILLAVISFIIFILVSGSGKKGNVETPKNVNDIINTINKNNKNVLPELETIKVDIKNIDEVTSYTGLKTNDGIESIVVSEPLVTAMPAPNSRASRAHTPIMAPRVKIYVVSPFLTPTPVSASS